jgi:hypothetical protein
MTIARIALFYSSCCLDTEYVRGVSKQSILKEIEDMIEKAKMNLDWAQQGYEIRLVSVRPLEDAVTIDEEELTRFPKFYEKNIKGCLAPREQFEAWNKVI